jgi:cytochrome c-type protein NapB
LGDKLNSARYNCNQCHVTQTNATLDVKNNFKADFRSEDAKKKSNLNDVINEGVK